MERGCDILILGSGAAGTTAAVTSAAGGAKTILAAFPSKRVPLGECLAPEGSRLLRRIHGEEARAAQLPYVGTRSRWASDEVREKSFLFHPAGSGLRLDRPAFDGVLLNNAQTAGADVIGATQILSADRCRGAWRVELKTSDSVIGVRASQVIDCTGRRSLFLRRQGIGRRQHDRLVALVMTAKARDEDGRLSLEAQPYGWWYRVVAPNGEEVVTLMTDSDLASATRLRAPGRLAELFSSTSMGRDRQGAFRATKPASVAASTSFPDSIAGEGWLAAGDAAAAYDPLSSEGIQKAIVGGRDAARAALAGDFSDYEERWRAAATAYLETRKDHYRANPRWPSDPFWARRHEARQDGPPR